MMVLSQNILFSNLPDFIQSSKTNSDAIPKVFYGCGSEG